MPISGKAASLGSQLSGRILLDVERHGEAWYIYPGDNLRYFLGRPTDAFAIMRQLGLGINEVDFQRIAQAGMPVAGDTNLARRLAGEIVIEVEKNGEAWYVNPEDLKKYYLGRPADAFSIMRELGLGITSENLAKIHKPGLEESIDRYSRYEHKTVTTAKGESYPVDMVEIDLANPSLKIFTDVADPHPSPDRDKNTATFGAGTLADYVLKHNGFAGINGTYFCSSGGCGSANYYFYPVFDSDTGELVNDSELKYWTTGPIIAFDGNNRFHYFKDSRDFPAPGWSASGGKSVPEAFKEFYNSKLQAAIGNKPRLIENKMNLLIEWDIDKSQRDVKSVRNALAYTENAADPGHGTVYLVVARNATVPDLADIMQALGVDYAVNLDGGSSTALWYNDEYMAGPGRDIPNAIVFSE